MNLKRFVLLLITGVMALTLTGCQPAEEGAAVTTGQVVNVFNWEDYIAPEVITLFEEETGITVNYMCFTTNEDMIVQVEANPGAFDVCFPSDYIIERMIQNDMLAEIDFANVPNANQTLDHLLNPAYDPENKYSVPYMWGTVGILYNTTLIDEPKHSWSILWDPQYQYNIFMMDSIRDSFGVTLKYLGNSVNCTEVPALFDARDMLVEQKKLGVVKAYQVDETKDKMVAGEAALAVMWSGDAMYAIDLNEDLDYFVPEEGSNVWVDGAVIPKTAKNKANAEAFINFLCRPDIAAMNWDYIWYSTPNKGAIELIEDPEGDYAYDYSDNHVLSPSDETLDTCEFFQDISEDYLSVYEALWMDVKNTK
ncbi:MAG: ABC transporter substrate-binding protein [Clostridia bacterium]|nr:ABC transporter substrate-binding protein [Clostridia bacterium]